MELAVEWRHTMHITACLDSWPFGCRETFRNGLVSQTVKLTKGAFLPRGPGDICLGREKGLRCFYVYMHIMHIVYGVYVFISMWGSKTTQSFPFVSNPTHPARPKLNPHNMMWCYNRDAAIASYVQVCTGLHTCINYHIFSVIISNHVALF